MEGEKVNMKEKLNYINEDLIEKDGSIETKNSKRDFIDIGDKLVDIRTIDSVTKVIKEHCGFYINVSSEKHYFGFCKLEVAEREHKKLIDVIANVVHKIEFE